MTDPKQKISVFIASPGGLEEERDLFPNIVQQLNEGFGDGANVEFCALRFEDLAASSGPRAQSVIDPLIDSCDVFIAVFYKRWGRSSPDIHPFTSFTEAEFHRAFARWDRERAPRIFVYFKTAGTQEGEPDEQFQQVLAFRQQLEDSGRHLLKFFSTLDDFKSLVDRHLRLFAKGELPEPNADEEITILPSRFFEQVKTAQETAEREKKKAEQASRERDAALKRLELMELEVASSAAELARSSRIAEARSKFVNLAKESRSSKVLFICASFFQLTGDIEGARSVLKLLLDEGQGLNDSGRAQALGYLGRMEEILGATTEAERLYRQSLNLYQEIKESSGVARQHGHLGYLLMKQGKMPAALSSFERQIALSRESNDRAGIFWGLKNIANIYQHTGQREKAKSYFHEALSLASGPSEVAEISSELGTIYYDLNDMDESLKYHEQSLALFTEMKNLPGVAKQNGNLGNYMLRMGRWAEGEKYLKKGLALAESMGDVNGIAIMCGSLASLYVRQEKPVEAKKLWSRSIALKKSIGDEVGLAHQLLNSCEALIVLSDFESALEVVGEALDLEVKYGREPKVAVCKNRMGGIFFQLGDYAGARVAHNEAIDIDEKFGGGEVTGGSYMGLAMIDQQLGDKESALRNVSSAISEFERVQSPMLFAAERVRNEILSM